MYRYGVCGLYIQVFTVQAPEEDRRRELRAYLVALYLTEAAALITVEVVQDNASRGMLGLGIEGCSGLGTAYAEFRGGVGETEPWGTEADGAERDSTTEEHLEARRVEPDMAHDFERRTAVSHRKDMGAENGSWDSQPGAGTGFSLIILLLTFADSKPIKRDIWSSTRSGTTVSTGAMGGD